MSAPVIAPDAQRRLRYLEASLNSYPNQATIRIDELRAALDAWGFVRGPPLDASRPDAATFHYIEPFPTIQTPVEGTGFAHPLKVVEVVGLINSLRIRLQGGTP